MLVALLIESQHIAEKDGGKDAAISNELPSNSKPSKAERRALQESQRAAEAAAQGSSRGLSHLNVQCKILMLLYDLYPGYRETVISGMVNLSTFFSI